LHAPEVECIGKGKARKPYEFGVKVSLAVTHQHGLMVGARSFPGNPYDGHTLAEQLEQTNTLLQDIGVKPTTAVVDLGFRGVDEACAPVQLIHRGKFKSLDSQQRRWLKRRQAIEPAIGHAKSDYRMDRCWLSGSTGDALHAVLCAAGFNLRWLYGQLPPRGWWPFFWPSRRWRCMQHASAACCKLLCVPLGEQTSDSSGAAAGSRHVRRRHDVDFAGPTSYHLLAPWGDAR
jgi:IS5 family transposase